jgi:hypothetical protein
MCTAYHIMVDVSAQTVISSGKFKTMCACKMYRESRLLLSMLLGQPENIRCIKHLVFLHKFDLKGQFFLFAVDQIFHHVPQSESILLMFQLGSL